MKKFILALVIALLSTTNIGFCAEAKCVQTTEHTAVQLKKPIPIDDLSKTYNQTIKIFFTDIDGTIILTGKNAVKGEVPTSVKVGAAKLQQANIPLIIATGRSLYEASQFKEKIGIKNSYIIAEQGAEIVNPQGQIIFQDPIDKKDFMKMIKEIDRFKKKNHFTSRIFFVADAKPYATSEFDLPYIWEKRTVIKSYRELKPTFVYTKISICDTEPQNLKAYQAHLKQMFPKYHIDISADCYVDISSPTASKGNAIEKLSKILNLDLSHAAAIGDGENDISMIKAVQSHGGLGIAVGNAMEKLKQNANYIAAPVSQDGFAKTVDEVLKNNERLNKKVTQTAR